MRRHFGQGEFKFDKTSFDSTAFPPTTVGFVEFGRAALWYKRQDPDTWPRSETRFDDDVRDGLIELLKRMSGHFKLYMTTSISGDISIDFENGHVIEKFPQKAVDAADPSGLNATSLFQVGGRTLVVRFGTAAALRYATVAARSRRKTLDHRHILHMQKGDGLKSRVPRRGTRGASSV